MEVLKFGGSSVANASCINKVVDIISQKKNNVVVVSSALSGVTDLLINMSQAAAQGDETYCTSLESFADIHQEVAIELGIYNDKVKTDLDENLDVLSDLLKGIFLIKEISPRTLDYVLSFGERSSCYLISAVLNNRGFTAVYTDARKLIVTDELYNNARVDFSLSDQKIQHYFSKLNKDVVPIVTGFIAANKDGVTTTLGRGGSDYTASILASALEVERLEIWTDVNGVLTTDPRLVLDAYTIESMTYAEAMEMSHFGAKVIYPPTMLPVMKSGIPIYIKNTFQPDFIGTRISGEAASKSRSPIKGISALPNICMISVMGSAMMGVSGISAKLFSILASVDVNVILITQASSEYSISFAVKREDCDRSINALKSGFENDIVKDRIGIQMGNEDQTIIAVVGEDMKSVPGISGKLFDSLGTNGINVSAIAQGSTELNISFVIDTKDYAKALNLLHDSFFLSTARTYNLFVVGTGLIGGTLMDQIRKQKESLQQEQGIALRICGISNSKKMLFDSKGLSLLDIKERLVNSDLSTSPEAFISNMLMLNLPNMILVDNTANSTYPSYYRQILSNNISIVTPNKIAASSAYHQYLELKNLAKQKGIHFLYETNVGAGLPVISTIKSLMDSGDRILKIEGVLSGSLSYIFNNYDNENRFVDVVQKAKIEGYTEPDPRDDLSGSDIKRKITILSREAGYSLELSDVVISDIVPEEMMNANSVDDFMSLLGEEEAYFKQLLSEANSQGKQLKVIASMDRGVAKIALDMVDQSSPFYNLQGSDNMIVITSERYRENPLVIRGPGAGAQVTAAGVFSDIILICKSI